jgi:RimJ/RimL family protein N-acetyltransferase
MDLSSIARVEGPSLTLRLIQPEDAADVHSLRNNPAYNTHLSTVTGTVDDQRTWIKDYKSREAHGQEFYYVIERKDGTRCGLISRRRALLGAAGFWTKKNRVRRHWKVQF